MAAPKIQARPAKGASSGALSRSLLLGGFLAFWVLGLIARLYYLQVIKYVDFVGRAQRQQQRTVEVASDRGTIFDRQMHPLAMSVAVDSIYAVPTEIPDREMVAGMLAPVLGEDAGDLLGRFDAFRSFCWVKRKVSEQEGERVRALNLKGIYFQKEMKRFYPKGDLASHVLGYVGLDDAGLAGLEFGMNKVINGLPGRMLVAADARHQSFLSTEWKGEPGKNVVLAIDENIQYIAEKALAEAIEQWHAAGGTAVVQNPSTGEILAMANSPTLNANDFAKRPAADRVNRATGWVYEPGSTFKIVTVSAALEENLTNPNEVIDCQMGSIVLSRHVIHDHKRFGLLTVSDVLAKSSDVGAIKLGLRLGEDRLYRYIRDFGFGEKTDIQLPGEERGLLKPPSHWSGISIGAISMGQEVGVTPLQLVTAYSAIANGGVLIQPTLVRDVFRGTQHDPLLPPTGRRVVSERTARIMKTMFEGVFDHGTAVKARLNGYSAAGKTGTAQKIDASGHYSKSHYIGSLVGFAPVEHPAVTILVIIDSPVGAIYGADVAGPAFRSIAEQTLGYLDVPQDHPSQLPQVASSASAASARQEQEDVAEILPPESEAPETVTSSPSSNPTLEPVSLTKLSDPASAPASADQGTVLVDRGPLTTVPDFSGVAVRGVAAKCQRAGLELSVRGSGLAVEQNPPAGVQVPAGSTVTVRFAR